MAIKTLRGIVLRLLLAYIVAVMVAIAGGSFYVRAQQPLSIWATQALDSSYRVDSQKIEQQNGEMSIVVSLVAVKPFYVGMNEIQPDFPVGCSFSLGNVMLPFIVCLSVLGAWPGIAIRRRLWMVAVALVLLVPLVAADIAVTTLGTVEYLLYHDLAPGYIPMAEFMPWSSALIGGGWLAEGIIVALLTLAFWNLAFPAAAPKTEVATPT